MIDRIIIIGLIADPNDYSTNKESVRQQAFCIYSVKDRPLPHSVKRNSELILKIYNDLES